MFTIHMKSVILHINWWGFSVIFDKNVVATKQQIPTYPQVQLLSHVNGVTDINVWLFQRSHCPCYGPTGWVSKHTLNKSPMLGIKIVAKNI